MERIKNALALLSILVIIGSMVASVVLTFISQGVLGGILSIVLLPLTVTIVPLIAAMAGNYLLLVATILGGIGWATFK